MAELENLLIFENEAVFACGARVLRWDFGAFVNAARFLKTDTDTVLQRLAGQDAAAIVAVLYGARKAAEPRLTASEFRAQLLPKQTTAYTEAALTGATMFLPETRAETQTAEKPEADSPTEGLYGWVRLAVEQLSLTEQQALQSSPRILAAMAALRFGTPDKDVYFGDEIDWL